MMTVLVLTLGITAILMGGMAIGVLFGRSPLKGSCGGLAGAGTCACDEAGIPRKCENGEGPTPEQLVNAGALTSRVE